MVKDKQNQNFILLDTFSYLNGMFKLLQAIPHIFCTRHRSSTSICTQEALRRARRDSDYNTIYIIYENNFGCLDSFKRGWENRCLKASEYFSDQLDPLSHYATDSATSCILLTDISLNSQFTGRHAAILVLRSSSICIKVSPSK